MANENAVKYVAAGTGPTYWGPGDTMRFLVTGKDTGGAFFMAETSVVPGGGPPPHIHRREDETFYLLKGTLAIQVGDKTLNASPGDFVHLPRGIPHTFKNTSNEDARMLVIATPAGIESFFEAVFDVAVEGAKPPQMGPEMFARLMEAASKAGMELHTPAH